MIKVLVSSDLAEGKSTIAQEIAGCLRDCGFEVELQDEGGPREPLAHAECLVAVQDKQRHKGGKVIVQTSDYVKRVELRGLPKGD